MKEAITRLRSVTWNRSYRAGGTVISGDSWSGGGFRRPAAQCCHPMPLISLEAHMGAHDLDLVMRRVADRKIVEISPMANIVDSFVTLDGELWVTDRRRHNRGYAAYIRGAGIGPAEREEMAKMQPVRAARHLPCRRGC